MAHIVNFADKDKDICIGVFEDECAAALAYDKYIVICKLDAPLNLDRVTIENGFGKLIFIKIIIS